MKVESRESRVELRSDERGITYGSRFMVKGSWFKFNDLWLGRQYVVRKAFSMFRRIGDLINHARIFPLDSLRFFPRIMWNGMRSAVRGE